MYRTRYGGHSLSFDLKREQMFASWAGLWYTDNMYYVYMLRCKDDSLYTGYTPDLKARMEEHFSGGPKGAKYVRSRGAKELAAFWVTEEKSDALKLEYRIKQLTKKRKESLVKDPGRLEEFLGDVLDCSAYVSLKDPSICSG